MKPDELKRLHELYAFMESLKRQDKIPLSVGQAFAFRLRKTFTALKNVPAALASAPLSLVTAPSGGATVDSQARTAINSVITRLEDLGLIEPN